MNKVGNYGVYASNYYDNTAQNRKEKEKTEAAGKTGAVKADSVPLSDKAKELLKELQNTYGNMDFMVARYDSEEEASAYLSRGTKEYSVLIDPEELERMADDAGYKEKTLALLEEAKANLDEIKGQFGKNKDEAVHLGVSIGKDGTLSYFAVLEKMNTGQRERLEKSQEHKKEEKVQREGKQSKGKDLSDRSLYRRATVNADSIEELLDKIRNFDWSTVKEEEILAKGSKIDFSI